MKVLDLRCAREQHAFEGWFASEDDFRDQSERGLLECPLCGDKDIRKLPSAPALQLGARPQVDRPATQAPAAEHFAAVGPVEQAALMRMLRRWVAGSEDVGERFAEEARRMHYGETQSRSIRGRTSAGEAVELLEEGIPVLPVPPVLKDTLQ
ncbi:MAG: hypothetical protein OJF60_001322 [Burkholderiaceae bacterium]|jgi:hypothetical protein|nr:MAG: hypothetical protein OJF60_001322 [Burkholderiaceae bacterium]